VILKFLFKLKSMLMRLGPRTTPSGITKCLIGYETQQESGCLENDKRVRIDESLSCLLPRGKIPIANAIRPAATLPTQTSNPAWLMVKPSPCCSVMIGENSQLPTM
jgi:hypothetical protein